MLYARALLIPALVTLVVGCGDATPPLRADLTPFGGTAASYTLDPPVNTWDVQYDPSLFLSGDAAYAAALALTLTITEPEVFWSSGTAKGSVTISWVGAHWVSSTTILTLDTAGGERSLPWGRSDTLLNAHPQSPGYNQNGHSGNATIDYTGPIGKALMLSAPTLCGWTAKVSANAYAYFRFVDIFRNEAGAAIGYKEGKQEAKPQPRTSQPASQQPCDDTPISGQSLCDNPSTPDVAEPCGTNAVQPSGGPSWEGVRGTTVAGPTYQPGGFYCSEWTDWYLSNDGGQTFKYTGTECHRWDMY